MKSKRVHRVASMCVQYALPRVGDGVKFAQTTDTEPAWSRVKCTQSSSETPNRSKYGLGCTRRGPNGLGLDTAAVPHLAKPQLDTSHASPSRGVPARLGGPETRNLPSSRWSGRGSCQPTVDPKVLPRRACGVAPIQHENCFKILK